MSVTRIGITITIWDERDQQIATQGAWIDPRAIAYDRRRIYEDLCATAWEPLHAALDAARDAQDTIPVVTTATLLSSSREATS